MKKDRNCAVPYPIYPPYNGMMPGTPQMGVMPGMISQSMPQMGAMMPQSTMMNMDNNIEQQLNTMEQRINSLDNRITALENKYSTNYNSTNYQML